MIRVDLARTRVVATVDPEHLDFWIQVLHAHPDHDVQAAGDMLEERDDNPFAIRIVHVLERRFGDHLRLLNYIHQEAVVAQFVLRNLPHITLPASPRFADNDLEWFVRQLGIGLPIYVRLSIRGAPVPLSSLHPGQRFRREIDPHDVWTMKSRAPGGAVAICERGPGGFEAGDLVYLEPEDGG